MSESERPAKPRVEAADVGDEVLSVLPLRDIVVFPHMIVPLFVGREKSVRALEAVMNGDAPILLAASNGTVVAHTAICTHQGCTVGASGLCPCHMSRFNVATGAVEEGPATRPLAEIAVTVSGGQVYQA